MMGVRTPSGAPALVATLPPRRLPKSVHFSMATSVHCSVAIDTGIQWPPRFAVPCRRRSFLAQPQVVLNGDDEEVDRCDPMARHHGLREAARDTASPRL